VTKKRAEISGRVCPDEAPCEEPRGPLLGRVMSRLTGPSRPSEIIFVELLLSRRNPSNSASREFRLRRTCPTTYGRPLRVAACFHCFVLPGENKEVRVLLLCTPADNCWRYSSGTNSSKRNTVDEVRGSLPPETVDLVNESDLNSICMDNGRQDGDHGRPR